VSGPGGCPPSARPVFDDVCAHKRIHSPLGYVTAIEFASQRHETEVAASERAAKLYGPASNSRARRPGLIHVQGLTKRYGDKLALDNVSFNVGLGEVLGLLGLNGAGKSTAMNILTGYIGATSGTVTIDDHDIVREPLEAKRVIGYLPERLAFYGDMRVREFLDFVCDLKKVRAGRTEHVAGICERVGIAHITSRIIRNLSKGYRQRLGFAQALIGDP